MDGDWSFMRICVMEVLMSYLISNFVKGFYDEVYELDFWNWVLILGGKFVS